ncbi:ribonuclease H-like domain-containing protein [Tanacetum coccineum]
MTHPSPKKNIVPGAVLMRSCLVSLTTAKPLNTAQPRTTVNNYEEIDGGYVAFGGNPKGGKITGRDHLGKLDGKADEGFFVGYSINSKTFRVFNSRTKIVEENMHVQFSENTPNIAGSRPNWLFDIDALTKSMNVTPFYREVKQRKSEKRHRARPGIGY